MKNKTNKILIFIIILLIVIIVALGVILGINFLKKDNSSSEIKHTTETTVSSSDGVYLTDVSSVVENAMPSIVAITSKTLIQSGGYGPFASSSQYVEGAGSGIIISQTDDNIYILTNAHVIDNSSELTVQFIDESTADAKVVGSYERKDIAIISISKNDLSDDTKNTIKIATLGSSDDLKVGQGIIAIGNALGYGQSVTSGVISALNREVETDNYTLEMIQIDAAINGGNSGGALLDASGKVVGINSAKYSSSSYTSSASIEGMGFAIPISDVLDTIEDILSGKEEEDAITLGIAGYMTTQMMSGSTLPEGFYISEITSGSNADSSDLEIGNIITEVDGNEVTSVNVITKVLNKKSSGDTIKLKVKYVDNRSYKEKEISITLK